MTKCSHFWLQKFGITLFRYRWFSFKPIKGLIEIFKHFKEDFDSSDLDTSHELYSEDNKKVIGKMKLEKAPEKDLDETVFLGSKS